MFLWGLDFFSDHLAFGRRGGNRFSVVGLGGVTVAYLGILELAWVQKAVNLQQNRLQHALATLTGAFAAAFFIAICTQAGEIKTRSCLSVCSYTLVLSSVGIPEVCFPLTQRVLPLLLPHPTPKKGD